MNQLFSFTQSKLKGGLLEFASTTNVTINVRRIQCTLKIDKTVDCGGDGPGTS